jgi:hypothetical protein
MPVPLTRAVSSRSAAPLPDPMPGLSQSKYKVQWLRGNLSMLAGPAGAGKTMLALVLALRMNVPTLYISADSDESTMGARVASAVTGQQQFTVREAQTLGLFGDMYGNALADIPIRFAFDPSEPSIEDIANMITAYRELWSSPPELLIVDNLMNMTQAGDSGNEWGGMRQTMKDMHWLARTTRAHVMLLHHTAEAPDGKFDAWASIAPPRRAIQGKLSQLPSLILTVGLNGSELFVGVVKNRFGEADKEAANPVRMVVDFSRVQIWDQTMAGKVAYGQGTAKEATPFYR